MKSSLKVEPKYLSDLAILKNPQMKNARNIFSTNFISHFRWQDNCPANHFNFCKDSAFFYAGFLWQARPLTSSPWTPGGYRGRPLSTYAARGGGRLTHFALFQLFLAPKAFLVPFDVTIRKIQKIAKILMFKGPSRLHSSIV